MKRLFLVVLLTIFAACSAGVTIAQTSEEQPKVTKAVAPVYPHIAANVGSQGKVVVEMVIDRVSNIIRLGAIEGHKLLRQAAVDAGERWRFAPFTSGTATRTIHLTFIFRLVTDDKKQETSFSPPYQVEVAYKRSKILNMATRKTLKSQNKADHKVWSQSRFMGKAIVQY
jgi:TonB family protein